MIEGCAKFTIDKMGKQQKHLAPVSCDHNCDSCGWNPDEQKRRLGTGEFKPVHTRKGWDEETGWHEVVLPEGTRQLVFKKKEVTV